MIHFKDRCAIWARRFSGVWSGTGRLLKTNLPVLALFTVINAFSSVVMSSTVYYSVIGIAMRLSGDRYVDAVSFAESLRHPLIILVMLIGALLMAMISVFQVAGFCLIFRRSHGQRRVSLSEVVSAGLHNCLKSFLPQNWPVIILLFGLIPGLHLITVSTNYLEFYVPEYVMDYINASPALWLVYWGVMALFFVFVVIYLFSLNYYFLENGSFIRACRKSRRLTRGSFLFTAVTIFMIAIVFFALNAGFSAVFSEAAVRLTSLFAEATKQNVVSGNLQVSNISMSLRMLASEFLAPVFTLAVIHALHNVLLEEQTGREAVELKPDPRERGRIGYVIAAAVLFVGCSGYCIFSQSGMLEGFSEPSSRPLIAAHRGDSVRAPENTYPAFELAALENPDGMIELDVQQTRDGVIVVSHNDSLKKFTGDDSAIHELTYDEVMEIDVGSWFSPQYSGLRLSTLDEVLKLLKPYKDLYVQIEIKVAEYDHHLEQALVDILYANGMQDRCYVISLSPVPLERIKAIEPAISTLYTMSMAIGDISSFEAADGYSVEESYVTRQLVNSVHASGKTIYAWTANSGSTIQYLVDCGVDGILTDDPIMLDEALDTAYYDGGLLRILRIFVNMLHNF